MKSLIKFTSFLFLLFPILGNTYTLSQPNINLYEDRYAPQLISASESYVTVYSDLNAYEKQIDQDGG